MGGYTKKVVKDDKTDPCLGKNPVDCCTRVPLKYKNGLAKLFRYQSFKWLIHSQTSESALIDSEFLVAGSSWPYTPGVFASHIITFVKRLCWY